MESYGSLAGATLPEVLKSSAESRAAQSDDGICAIDSPVHARPFEASSDRHFASSFEDAGGGTQTLGVKFRVAHASAIVKDVQRAFGGLGGRSGMGAKSVDDGAQLAVIQFRAARRCPLLAFGGGAEDRLSGLVQSLFGVVPIEDLNGLGE